MKTMQHTPGPWYVRGTNPPMIYAREGLDIIAQVDSASEMLRAQERANARLIAAAPELLEELESSALAIRDLSKSLADAGIEPKQGWEAFRKARAAIAKARGE